MQNGACKRQPQCQLRTDVSPLELVSRLEWDGPATGRKAVSFPKGDQAGTIYLDAHFWDSLPSLPGRRAILFHEIGHLAGAECEDCADYYAGYALRLDGSATDRDGRRTLIGKLENRNGARAADNLHRGFGVEGPADPLAGRARQTVEGWEDGIKIPSLVVVDAGNGQWLEEGTARALELARLAFAKPVRVVSGWRSDDKQQELYDGYKAGKPGYNPADPPGYSKHENGRAADLAFDSDADREAFAKLAPAYGLTRPVSREPWHFLYGAPPPEKMAPVPEAPPSDGPPVLLLAGLAAAAVTVFVILEGS